MSRRTTAAVWTLAILAACSVPGEYIPNVPVLSPDKIVHVLLFLVLGVLWGRAYPHRLVMVFLGGIAFGVFIEVWQQALPIGRMAEAADVAADFVGLCIAFATRPLWRKRFSSETEDLPDPE